MYKNYEEYRINLERILLDLPFLYTTHFEKKIKPCLNAISIYYYRVDHHKTLFYMVINMWLKYDHFITIGLKHWDSSS